MVNKIDTIAPVTIGRDAISLTVDIDSEPLQTFKVLQINIDYSDAGDPGISVPLELIIQPGFGSGGTANGYKRTVYRRTAPTQFLYRPPAAGQYLILLREIHHNRLQGRLLIDVAGDKHAEPIIRERS
ncbi:MAG: hypothetical protein U9Q07_04300 [Planctomycetota bacterium]|nr:hypothetical protein [Planctomycetota bacterium]